MKLRRFALLFIVVVISFQLKAQAPGKSDLFQRKLANTAGIVANADKSMMNEDGSAFIEVLANDTGLGDNGIVTITRSPMHGTAIVNIDNTITYTSWADYNGTDMFTYQVCDAKNNCSVSTATITINPVNHPPIIKTSPIVRAMNENEGSTTLDIPDNIADKDGDILKVSVVKDPNHGIISVYGNGKLVYMPDINFNGTDTIRYQVCDNRTPSLCAKGLAIVVVYHEKVSPCLVSSFIGQPIQACNCQIQWFTRSGCQSK